MKKELTNTEIALLACHTCQWYQATLMQAKRFIDSLEKIHGDMPWDEGECSSIFHADRMFLIVAIKHSIKHLSNLNSQLQMRADYSCQELLEIFGTSKERRKILDLRDMNEHNIEYVEGIGHKQSKFGAVVRKNDYCIPTNAFYTIIHGDAKLFLLGDVEIDKLLLNMKDKLPFVRERTQAIFNHYYAL